MSTHSPVLVTPPRVENVVIVRQHLSEEGGCTTRCTVPDLDLLPNEEDKQLAAMLKFANSSEFLFADYVLVVEGPSDRSLLEASWSDFLKSTEDVGGSTTLAVIEACNKSVVPIWLKYLAAMGISAKGVVDLDFIWDGAGKCLGADPELSQFSESFWRLAEECGISSSRDGQRFIPQDKKPQAFELIRNCLREVAETLRTRLRKHGMWVLARGEIESYFGLSSSSKSRYAIVSQKVRRGEMGIDPEVREIFEWVLQ